MFSSSPYLSILLRQFYLSISSEIIWINNCLSDMTPLLNNRVIPHFYILILFDYFILIFCGAFWFLPGNKFVRNRDIYFFFFVSIYFIVFLKLQLKIFSSVRHFDGRVNTSFFLKQTQTKTRCWVRVMIWWYR